MNGVVFGILNLLAVLRTICNDANVYFYNIRTDTDILAYTNNEVSSIRPAFYMIDNFFCRLVTTTPNVTYRLRGRFLTLLGVSPIPITTSTWSSRQQTL
jgi:hypothetical protein